MPACDPQHGYVPLFKERTWLCMGNANLRQCHTHKCNEFAPPHAAPGSGSVIVSTEESLAKGLREDASLMSQMGHSRRFWPISAASAYPPKVTEERTWTDVRKVPVATVSKRQGNC